MQHWNRSEQQALTSSPKVLQEEQKLEFVWPLSDEGFQLSFSFTNPVMLRWFVKKNQRSQQNKTFVKTISFRWILSRRSESQILKETSPLKKGFSERNVHHFEGNSQLGRPLDPIQDRLGIRCLSTAGQSALIWMCHSCQTLISSLTDLRQKSDTSVSSDVPNHL